jgi:hypothetical protein
MHSHQALRKTKFFGAGKPYKQVPVGLYRFSSVAWLISLKPLGGRTFSAFDTPKIQIFRSGCAGLNAKGTEVLAVAYSLKIFDTDLNR